MPGDRPSSGHSELRAWALSLMAGQPSRSGRGIADQLDRLCRVATVGLHLAGAAVTLRSTDGSQAVAASSDSASASHAEVELGVGEGPAHDAFNRGKPVLVSELGGPHDGSWPGYTAIARAGGIVGVFAFPLRVGAARFGVLSLFCNTVRQLDDHEVARGLVISEIATEMLLDSSSSSVDGEIDPDLKSALGFRGEIYQAQGIVMVALGVSLPEALARMRGHAFLEGRDLVEVSVDIVEGRLALTNDRRDP